LFRNRREAGERLAELLPTELVAPLIMAIPRGGVPVGAAMSDATGIPLDVVVTRKIRAPFNHELALGAITPTGRVLLNEEQLSRYGLTRPELEDEIQRQEGERVRRVTEYRGDAEYADLAGRALILVDDGVATGLTMKAALEGLAQENPKELIVAVPVAPRRTVGMLERQSDAVYCLYAAEHFYAVSQFYMDFHQVTDDEVRQFLRRAEDPNEG